MVYIVEYQSDWPASYERIAATLLPHLAPGWKLHHVGSTSVPHLPAKDIIDLVLECRAGEIRAVIDALAAAGYEHEGDLGIATREAFRPWPDSPPAVLPQHHLYACEAGSPELHKQLAFRDYLRQHRDRAEWLGAEKRRADARAAYRSEYIDGKAAAYTLITGEALAWARARDVASGKTRPPKSH